MVSMPSKRTRRSTVQDNGPVHCATLSDLPVELLFHIASTYPQVHHMAPMSFPDTRLYFERLDALRALSQTSKALRHIFLPLAWECIESYYKRCDTGDGSSPYLADKLLRLTEGLLKNPSLAAYVRFAFIFVPDINPVHLMPCLLSLPNLHTLRYESQSSRPYLFPPPAARFPSIRTLVIAACDARNLIPCCPKVKAVISCARMLGWSNLKGMFDEMEKSLEELDGFTLNEQDVDYIVQVAPNLRRIAFTDWVPREIIQRLHPLARLQSISMAAQQQQVRRHRCQPKSTAELDAWVATAVDVLRGNECSSAGDRDRKGKKRVKMHYVWIDYTQREVNGNGPKTVERREDVEVE